MINARRLICSGIVAVLVAGCSTPASRIEKHLDVFNTFPLEAQALIRQGKIDIGFTPDMVRIALGDPSREYNRKSADAESEVWSYVDYNYSTERQRADVNVPVYDAGGRRTSRHESIWVDVQKSEEYEKLRIEFKDGKVSAIETVQR